MSRHALLSLDVVNTVDSHNHVHTSGHYVQSLEQLTRDYFHEFVFQPGTQIQTMTVGDNLR